MINFGQLKLSLMQTGVYIPADLFHREELAHGFNPAKNMEEIVFALNDYFFVKTFLKDEDTGGARVKIRDGQVLISSGEDDVAVDVMPLPKFLKKQQNDISPAAQNVFLDGYCLTLFFRSVGGGKKLNMTIDAILPVIQEAFAEGFADLIQINLDYSPEPDRGFNRVIPVIEQIKKNFSTFICLRGFPPQSKRTIDRVYASGVDLLNYPLEGFSKPNKLDHILPSQHILQGLEYAAEIFPQGSVSTELVFGSGSTAQIKNKIDRLTHKGITPLLKLPQGTDQYDQVVAVAGHLLQAAQRDRLNLKWLYPTCHFLTPLDCGFFTDDPATARLTVRPIYQSKLEKKAMEGYTILRRTLRVKNISDSYESAGL